LLLLATLYAVTLIVHARPPYVMGRSGLYRLRLPGAYDSPWTLPFVSGNLGQRTTTIA
jgi:hypothetical protein